MKKLNLGAVFAAFLLTAAACGSDDGANTGGDNASTGGADENTNSEEVSGSILVAGSSAMEPLVAAASEVFMEENLEASISVQAGGSGQGLSSIASGQVEIGNSDVFAEEKDDIDASNLVDHRIAVVGMGPAAHPEVGVDDLSTEEMIDIFTGEVTNWSEIGGADQDIVLVNRPDSSGTRDTFVKYGLEGNEPSSDAITEDSSSTVRQIISETPGAIGYLAFSYYDDQGSVLPLSVDGVEQTDENVMSGDFPIWAYMHSYTNGEPEGLTKAFIDFLFSETVQDGVIPEMGYIPETGMQVERDAEGNETAK
ncbi:MULTISPECIES: phosphate ABC transporter substrate-binding protein [Shouchella]|uniref:Phosphate-binding protein n=2 Tax=Shouchella TaxID=2893057 RepID=A0ABY7W960_9BACI|nr:MULTISPECIES: phosphate ABC transporter substrate-binding protein [Shouchella]MED4127640.1 phosphate ABC transporter substrate-binding protein [Shouchella miscanthi]WDF04078.1 phosphate ABC transporter substrate-binding protein [Shouchella hunanensis]